MVRPRGNTIVERCSGFDGTGFLRIAEKHHDRRIGLVGFGCGDGQPICAIYLGQRLPSIRREGTASQQPNRNVIGVRKGISG